MVPIRTHTALNHIGLAAVSFRLVFTLFNAQYHALAMAECAPHNDVIRCCAFVLFFKATSSYNYLLIISILVVKVIIYTTMSLDDAIIYR